MRNVSIKAINIQPGDVLNGERVRAVHRFVKRQPEKGRDKDSMRGVLVVSPNPNGYDLRTRKFRGDRRIVVKRPKYNMA